MKDSEDIFGRFINSVYYSQDASTRHQGRCGKSEGSILRSVPVIFLYIDDKTCLRYFLNFINAVVSGQEFDLTIIAREKSLSVEIAACFHATTVVVGYAPESLTINRPDIIICNQVWWWGIVPVLRMAIGCNIPILHYDHGSLIYLSPYLLEGNEEATRYRSNIYLCSHVACWGQRAKDCWVSYAVPEEKIYVTGAMHLDSIHAVQKTERDVRLALHIPHDKKIIFCYSAFTGQILEEEQALAGYMDELNRFVEAHPEFHLVVKPHPSEMLWFKEPRYLYSPETTLIANDFEDCEWAQILRISPEAVIAYSSIVLSPPSSALTSPLSMNVPLVVFKFASRLIDDFADYCTPGITFLIDPGMLGETIQRILHFRHEEAPELAKQFNRGNDGKATERFIELMRSVLEESRGTTEFYTEEKKDIETCMQRYPFLPFPYYRMVKYFCESGSDSDVMKWLSVYCSLFKNPLYLLQELLYHYTHVAVNLCMVIEVLEMMLKYKPADFGLLYQYKQARMMACEHVLQA